MQRHLVSCRGAGHHLFLCKGAADSLIRDSESSVCASTMGRKGCESCRAQYTAVQPRQPCRHMMSVLQHVPAVTLQRAFPLGSGCAQKAGTACIPCSHLLCVNPPSQSSITPHLDKRDPNQGAQMPQQANQMCFFAVSGLHPSPTRALSCEG